MRNKETKFSVGEKVYFLAGDFNGFKKFVGKVHQIITIDDDAFYNIFYNNGFIDKLIFLRENEVHKCKK